MLLVWPMRVEKNSEDRISCNIAWMGETSVPSNCGRIGDTRRSAASWMVHGTRALFLIDNGGEPATIYGRVLSYMAAMGSEVSGVDAA